MRWCWISALAGLLALSAGGVAEAATCLVGSDGLAIACTSAAECADQTKCDADQACCVAFESGDVCYKDSDCPNYLVQDTYCVAGQNTCRQHCYDSIFCLTGEYCDATTHQCILLADGDADSDACIYDSECTGSMFCDDRTHQCRARCTDTSQCAFDEVCNNYRCEVNASLDGDEDSEADTAARSEDGDTEAEVAEHHEIATDGDSDSEGCAPGQVCIDHAKTKASGCTQNGGAWPWLLIGGLVAAALGRRARRIGLGLFIVACPLATARAADLEPDVAACAARGKAATAETLFAGYEFGTRGTDINGYVMTKCFEIAQKAQAKGQAPTAAELKDILERPYLMVPLYLPAESAAELEDPSVEWRQEGRTVRPVEILRDPVRKTCEGERCLYTRDVYAAFAYGALRLDRPVRLVVRVGTRRAEFSVPLERMS